MATNDTPRSRPANKRRGGRARTTRRRAARRRRPSAVATSRIASSRSRHRTRWAGLDVLAGGADDGGERGCLRLRRAGRAGGSCGAAGGGLRGAAGHQAPDQHRRPAASVRAGLRRARCVTEERPVDQAAAASRTRRPSSTTRTRRCRPDRDRPAPRSSDLLEGVAIEEPLLPADAPLALPPVVDYWHLDVPDDVSLGCNADRAHRAGVTGTRDPHRDGRHGAGPEHAFFTDAATASSRPSSDPGTADATIDENGHGTGESANIFVDRPDITLLPVKTATLPGRS